MRKEDIVKILVNNSHLPDDTVLINNLEIVTDNTDVFCLRGTIWINSTIKNNGYHERALFVSIHPNLFKENEDTFLKYLFSIEVFIDGKIDKMAYFMKSYFLYLILIEEVFEKLYKKI